MEINNNEKTIIYIMSDVRSGSTLLENILSNAPKTLSVGEIHHLDSYLYKGKRGKTVNWVCSCGKSTSDCEYWKAILTNLKRKNIKISNTSIKQTKSGNKQIIENYNLGVIKHIDEIYNAIFDENDVDIIVDSSKKTTHGQLLYNNSKYNIRIIYLKRDIRAVTFSKAKWAKKNNQKEKSLYHILRRTKIHDIKLKKALRTIAPDHLIEIKYEELAKQPHRAIKQIVQKFGLPSFDVPEYMDFSNNHTIGGTPTKFEKSPIKYDDKWEELSKRKPVFHVVGKLVDLL